RKADDAERERLLAQGDAERARLETVLQQLPVGVVIADAGGEIVMANRQVDAILGAAPAPFAAAADDDGQPPHAALERAIRDGETVEAAEFRVRRADGGVGLVRANAAPVRDRAGRIVAGVLTMEDITDSRREEAAQRLLAAVGEFLAAPIDDATALEALARLTLPDFADACLIELDHAEGAARSLVVAAVDPTREAAWRSAPWPSAAVPGAFDPFAALMRAGLPALLADGASEPALATAFGAPPPASILAVPLTLRGRTSGTLTFLMTDSGRRFDEADVRLALELARRVATALDNGRLYADEQRARRQAERTTDRLARLQALTSALAEAVTVDEVGTVVVGQSLAAVGATSATLALLGGDGETIDIVAFAGEAGEPASPTERPLSLDQPSPFVDAIRSGQPIFAGFARDEREGSPAAEHASDAAPGAHAVVPLLTEGRAIGAIGLTFAATTPFGAEQTDLMHAFARQSTQAIERARLYAAERAARADAEAARSRLAFLAEASATLGASLDNDATLRRLGGLLVPALADWCAIHLIRDDGTVEQLVVAHADPAKVAWARALQERYPYDPTAPTGVPNVLRTGKSELYPEITDDYLVTAVADEAQLELARAIGFSSAMIVPLIAHDIIFGAISLVTAESGRHYDDDDLRFAEDLARRAAIAVSNARHYEAEESARQDAERANIRKTQLQTITAALAEALTPDDVARAMVDECMAALGAMAGSVSLQTDRAGVYRIVYAQGYDDERLDPWRTFTPETPIPLADAIRRRTPILIGSVAEIAARYPRLAAVPGRPASLSAAAIPLVSEDRVVGVLGLNFAAERSFAADDVAFMLALARQSVVALERARLYDAERLARDKAQAAEYLARR
ncbi:MAG TPA: GAF domain-containing protein, partial [Thermomicrobiales bacterium]|nr:GAF domain-containing protein [Thermomicrobiales bacterium]